MADFKLTVTTVHSDLIRDMLRREGITQRSLASRWGLSEAAVSKMLSGEKRLSYERLVDLGALLKMRASTLGDVIVAGGCTECEHCRAQTKAAA